MTHRLKVFLTIIGVLAIVYVPGALGSKYADCHTPDGTMTAICNHGGPVGTFFELYIDFLQLIPIMIIPLFVFTVIGVVAWKILRWMWNYGQNGQPPQK